MTKQELIERIGTRIEFANADIATAASRVDRDIATIKKIFLFQMLELAELTDQPPQEPCEVCKGYGKIDDVTTSFFNYLVVTGALPQCVIGQYPKHASFCPNCGRKIKQ